MSRCNRKDYLCQADHPGAGRSRPMHGIHPPHYTAQQFDRSLQTHGRCRADIVQRTQSESNSTWCQRLRTAKVKMVVPVSVRTKGRVDLQRVRYQLTAGVSSRTGGLSLEVHKCRTLCRDASPSQHPFRRSSFPTAMQPPVLMWRQPDRVAQTIVVPLSHCGYAPDQ